MSPEVNFVVQNAPEVAAAVGFAAGMAIDVVLGKHAADRHTGAMHTHGLNDDEFKARNVNAMPTLPVPTEPQTQPEPSPYRYSYRDAVWNTVRRPLLPLGVALAAALSVNAFVGKPAPTKTVQPVVEAVAQNDNDAGNDGSASKIDSILATVGSSGQVKLEPIASVNGDNYPTTADQLNRVVPWGPASLDGGLSMALQTSDQVKSQGQGTVDLLTENDTRLGSIMETPAQDAQQIIKEAAGTKIDILNFPQGNVAVENELKAIAAGTGGIYMDGSASSVPQIESKIEQALGPIKVKEHIPKQSNGLDKVLSILADVLVVGLIADRLRLKHFGRRRQLKPARQANPVRQGL